MREYDWFIEIAKKSPFLAAGLYIFLIGPTGQAVFTNLDVLEPWRTICALIGIAIVGWQGYLLWNAQRLPKTELPIGQQPQNVLRRLMLHSSPNQKTELISRTDGLELNFADYKRSYRSRRYLLSLDELRIILSNQDIDVTENSAQGPKFGRIKIGRLFGWLYNRKMHENPDILQREIYSLVQTTVNNSP